MKGPAFVAGLLVLYTATAALTATQVQGQGSAALAFEAASVKPSNPDASNPLSALPLILPGGAGRITASNMPLKNLRAAGAARAQAGKRQGAWTGARHRQRRAPDAGLNSPRKPRFTRFPTSRYGVGPQSGPTRQCWLVGSFRDPTAQAAADRHLIRLVEELSGGGETNPYGGQADSYTDRARLRGTASSVSWRPAVVQAIAARSGHTSRRRQGFGGSAVASAKAEVGIRIATTTELRLAFSL